MARIDGGRKAGRARNLRRALTAGAVLAGVLAGPAMAWAQGVQIGGGGSGGGGGANTVAGAGGTAGSAGAAGGGADGNPAGGAPGAGGQGYPAHT